MDFFGEPSTGTPGIKTAAQTIAQFERAAGIINRGL